jgi:glycosyltransferase involved in cell wall biosynthesis
MGAPEVTLIIPAYNEEAVIEQTLEQVKSFVGDKFDYVLCIANDGSTDSTAKIVDKAAKSDSRILHIKLEKNQGRGAVLTRALGQCNTKYAIYFDADLQIDLSALPEAMAGLREGHDLVIGSKHHPESKLQYSALRMAYSIVYRNLARFILGCPVRDFQCGLKGFTIERIRQILPFLKHKGWSWDTEVCAKAHWAGMSIKELPVDVGAGFRPTRVHLLKDVYRMGKGILQIRADKRDFLKKFNSESN